MRHFTLGSIGLSGNYSISINYESSDTNKALFTDFICRLDSSQNDNYKSQTPKKQNQQNLPEITNDVSTYSRDENILSAQSNDDILGLEFTIFEPSHVSITSRTF